MSPVGVVGKLYRPVSPRGGSRLQVCVGSAGSGRPGHRLHGPHKPELGTGRMLDADLARLVAIAETAERYAGRNPIHRPVTSTAAALPGRVLDMSRIPRCSANEYAHPRCPLSPYDPATPIRWVSGVDLHSGDPIWVPAVMACYGVYPKDGERFWYQVSTGNAVHTDPAKAVAGAIMEVLERDLIAVAWLQRLPLPPLPVTHHTEDVRYLLDWSDRRFVTTHLFDATTDLGVPTVYALATREFDPRVRRVVGCSTGATLGIAAEKALLELLTAHEGLDDEPVPAGPEDFTEIADGAVYLAQPQRSQAFDFLLADLADRPPRPQVPELPEDPDELLRHLIGALAARGMQAVAVDLTSRELAEAGLTGVRVLIPELQPMSLRPYAQFLGHPRLYEAPRLMGYRSLTEEELNPWPQPFA